MSRTMDEGTGQMITHGIRNDQNIPLFAAIDASPKRLTIPELAIALKWSEEAVQTAINEEDGIVLRQSGGKVYVDDVRDI